MRLCSPFDSQIFRYIRRATYNNRNLRENRKQHKVKMSRAPIKFYFDLLSQPSRALFIFMKQAKIAADEFPVALRKGK